MYAFDLKFSSFEVLYFWVVYFQPSKLHTIHAYIGERIVQQTRLNIGLHLSLDISIAAVKFLEVSGPKIRSANCKSAN
jgi:hypothetical protein